MVQLPLDFQEYLGQLNSSWPILDWDYFLQGGPAATAILVVDLVRGFTQEGPLSGPRVDRLVPPTVEFLHQAYQRGIRQFYFGCDSHPPDSPEFRCFPPHCIQGSPEADLDPRLSQLPFASEFQLIPKRCLSSFADTGLMDKLLARTDLRRLVFVGDCTDLCIYHGAMAAQMAVNCHKLPWEVIVVSSLVDTYDLPVPLAQQIGAVPHPGDFMQAFFLYHMHLNGIKIVSEIR